jgi:CRP/FNR family transcriptional regulator
MINQLADPFVPATRQWHLSLEEFEEAGVRVAERHFGPTDLIFAPGDPGGHLYFLLEGTVRLYKIYGDYKEATVALLKDTGVFGVLDLDEALYQDAFAEAVTDARVVAARKPILNEVMKRHPEFAMKLLSSLAERLRQSDEVIESLLHREVSVRLATLLLNLGDRFGEPNGSERVLKVRLTHQDLANMIASTREAVSKVMSDFQRAGLIEVRNRRIAISPRLAKVRLGDPSSGSGAAA